MVNTTLDGIRGHNEFSLMSQTRLGDSILVTGGIQILLVLVAWVGALLRPHHSMSWFVAIMESSLLWFDLVWAGLVLVVLGVGIRSGSIRIDGYPRGQRAFLESAAIVAILGLLTIVAITLPYAAQ